MKYTVDIKYCGNTLFSVDVEANNEVEAMEFAYDQLELNTYAEAKLNESKTIWWNFKGSWL